MGRSLRMQLLHITVDTVRPLVQIEVVNRDLNWAPIAVTEDRPSRSSVGAVQKFWTLVPVVRIPH